MKNDHRSGSSIRRRRFFDRDAQVGILFIALILGLFVWVADAALDYYVFYEGGFFELLFLNPPHHEIYIRILILLCFLGFGGVVAHVVLNLQASRKELERKETDLRATLHSIGDAVIATDTSGRIQRMNERSESLTGWSLDEAQGLPLERVFRIVNSFSRKAVANPVRKVIEQGVIQGLANHTVLIAKDGSEHQIADSASPIRSDKGSITGVVLVFRDVTEQYRQEELLRKQGRRLANVVEGTDAGIWELNIQTCDLFFDATWLRHLGYDPDAFSEMDRNTWRELFHPQDLEKSDRLIAEHLSGHLDAYECEIRLRRRDGSWAWALDRGKVTERTCDGEAVLVSGTVRDITKRKHSEEALRESRRQLSTLMANLPGMAYRCLNDSYWTMLFVSDGCLELTGYSARDLIENRTVSYADLVRPEERDRVWNKVQQGLEQNGNFEVEYKIITAGGEEKHVWEQGTGVYQNERLAFLEGFINDITERKQAENRIYYLAYYDELTALPNRRLFHDRLKQVAARNETGDDGSGVFLVDITRLREVNNTLGPRAGDELIKTVAQHLRDTVFEEDTVARVSGGEFMILARGRSTDDQARDLGAQILERIGQRLELSGRLLYPEVNIGFTLFPHKGTDPETLIKQANMALSVAKKSAHSIQEFAWQEEWLSRQFHLEHDLKQALTHEEFFLCYQPQIDLRNGRVVGLEALLRWQHPERGVVSPAEFIPVLERTGMIASTDEWVVHRVCEQLKSWQERGVLVKIAVNISAQEFNNDAIIGVVRSALEGKGLLAANLEVEITETDLMENMEKASRILQTFSSWGVGVALDDFGKGYSCMSYLQKLAINTIKIDKEFVSGLPENEDSAILVQTIIAMAHNMGKKVLAEGVEREEQRQKLCDLGCDYGQGFLWDRPQPAERIVLMGN